MNLSNYKDDEWYRLDIQPEEDIRKYTRDLGNWSLLTGQVYGDGGFWIGGATGIATRGGSVEVCRSGKIAIVRNVKVDYLWKDRIDANSFVEQWRRGNIQANRHSISALAVNLIEGLFDLVGDKLLDLDYSVRIPFHHIEDDEWIFKMD